MTLDKVSEEQTEHCDVVRKGYLRKLKKNKRRYFVLRTFSRHGSGRLECYSSEKKFKEGSNPGKTIFFSEIFNFAETNDEECDVGFSIFLKGEKFNLAAELLDDRDNWLEALKFVKTQGMMLGKLPKYEFLWKIHIKDQGITRGTNLIGDHRLAKIGNSLSVIKRNTEEVIEQFQLSNIRQSGQSGCFVLFEIGRSHPLGPGELWFEAQDMASAEDIHRILFSSSLRPKSYISTEGSRPILKTMTNRRRSDGADRSKPGKRSFLPFLRSKLKETEAYAEKSFPANPKRSLSAADIRRVGVNQNEDLYTKIFSGRNEQTSSVDTRKDSTASKKSRRLSLFRNKKQMSVSVQDLHKVDNRDMAKGTYRTSAVNSLLNYDSLSRSAQNINLVESPSNSPSQNSSRLANIKKLSQMKSASDIYLANIAEKCHVTNNDGYRRVIPNGRPVTMALNGSAETTPPVLRKNKWKSLDGNLKDSPAESSEDCSSIGSFDSDKPLLNSSDETETNDRKSLIDEGYVRMNYNNVEGITEQTPVPRNSMYVLIKPDSNLPPDEEVPEEYMEMSPGNNVDFNKMLHGVDNSTEVASVEKSSNYTEEGYESTEHVPKSEAISGESGKVSCQRSISQQSGGSDSDRTSSASPTTPEKRNKFRGFRKQMTMNWRPNKNLSSPKKRYSEATSHFYVDTFPSETEEKSGLQLNDSKFDFRSCDNESESSIAASNKQKEILKNFPARPNHLDLKCRETENDKPNALSPVEESNWAIEHEDEANIDAKEANIYATVDGDDIDLNSESVRKNSEISQSGAQTSRLQSKKHQNYTRVGKGNETVYTEVTLKEKSHTEMPSARGSKSSSDERRQQGSKPNQTRKISNKILSSPTAESKGYENISLGEGVITTPLNEVEGRPYVNLGFHQQATGKSKKSSAHKRRSGDDAALRQLIALQSGRKISGEDSRKVITRSKSQGDEEDDFNDFDDGEAMYVNVNRENKTDLGRSDYAFDTGDISRANGRDISGNTTSESNDCTYENLSSHAPSTKNSGVITADLNANVKTVDNFEIKQKVRQSPTAKQKSRSNDIYANIGEDHHSSDFEKFSNEFSRAKINDRDNRPIPAPRPKKNARRKVGQAYPVDGQPSSPSKQSHCRVGSPQKSPDMGRSSYVNVRNYRDDFDAVQQSQLASTSAKSQSYENLADEFPARRNQKKSIDWSLAYADVGIHQKDHGEILYADIGPSRRPDSANKSSPNSDHESSPRAKHSASAYTEVDFKKSQGISEAVREQRAESTETSEIE